MAGIPFVHEIEFDYSTVDRLSPLIRRVICKNPGPFTYTGTGTYIIGNDNVAVIDPGPRDEAHLAALMKAIEGETVTHILITHTHNDHSPLAKDLKAATGAKTYAYGPHGSGQDTGAKVEEGGDMEFDPDVRVKDGDVIEGDGWSVECVYTPGHTSNHMCFALREEKALFTGDHVMGWSTSVIVPPDGNMEAYFSSLRKLLARDDEIYWPTHGPAITDPKPFVEAFIHHREAREFQILACLSEGMTRIPEMVASMYRDVDARLHPAAARSVEAHLIHMEASGRAARDGDGWRLA
jgi:glyoxylase-like metal-dependent hydrolase (beta-lactamase superfamily II)